MLPGGIRWPDSPLCRGRRAAASGYQCAPAVMSPKAQGVWLIAGFVVSVVALVVAAVALSRI